MIHRIRVGWGTARRREENGALLPSSAAAGQGTVRPPRRRHAAGAAAALRQIETEAPVERPAGTPAPERHVYDAGTLRWLWKQVDANDETAGRLESEAYERLELAKNLRDRNVDLKMLLLVTNAIDVVHVPGDNEVPAAEKQPAAPSAGPCLGCGQMAGTVRSYNRLEGREVPLCPRCRPSADAGNQDQADAGSRAEPAPVPAAAAPDDDPDTALLPVAGRWPMGDTLVDLYALDGVQ